MIQYAEGLMASLAAYPAIILRDRRRLGVRECRAAWLLARPLEADGDVVWLAEVPRCNQELGRDVSTLHAERSQP